MDEITEKGTVECSEKELKNQDEKDDCHSDKEEDRETQPLEDQASLEATSNTPNNATANVHRKRDKKSDTEVAEATSSNGGAGHADLAVDTASNAGVSSSYSSKGNGSTAEKNCKKVGNEVSDEEQADNDVRQLCTVASILDTITSHGGCVGAITTIKLLTRLFEQDQHREDLTRRINIVCDLHYPIKLCASINFLFQQVDTRAVTIDWELLAQLSLLIVKITNMAPSLSEMLTRLGMAENIVKLLKREHVLRGYTRTQFQQYTICNLLELLVNYYSHMPGWDAQTDCVKVIRSYEACGEPISGCVRTSLHCIALSEQAKRSQAGKSTSVESEVNKKSENKNRKKTKPPKSRPAGVSPFPFAEQSAMPFSPFPHLSPMEHFSHFAHFMQQSLGRERPETQDVIVEKMFNEAESMTSGKIADDLRKWVEDPNWLNAFKKTETVMWTYVQDLFTNINCASGQRDEFCEGICRVNVCKLFHRILANSDIREGFQRNTRVKFVVKMSLETLRNIFKPRATRVVRLNDLDLASVLIPYVSSKDVSLRLVTYLVASCVTPTGSDVFGEIIHFDQELVQAIISNRVNDHITDEELADLSDFLARLQFCKEMIDDFERTSRRICEESVDIPFMFVGVASMHLLTDKSVAFCEKACSLGMLKHIAGILTEPSLMMKRHRDEIKMVIHVCNGVVYNCSKIMNNKYMLVEGLYKSLRCFAMESGSNMRVISFLAFVHIHGYTDKDLVAGMKIKWPTIRGSYDDVCLLSACISTFTDRKDGIKRIANFLVDCDGVKAFVSILEEMETSPFFLKTEQVFRQEFNTMEMIDMLIRSCPPLKEQLAGSDVMNSLLGMVDCSVDDEDEEGNTFLSLLASVILSCIRPNETGEYYTEIFTAADDFLDLEYPDDKLQRYLWKILATIYKYDANFCSEYHEQLISQVTENGINRTLISFINGLVKEDAFGDQRMSELISIIGITKEAVAKLKTDIETLLANPASREYSLVQAIAQFLQNGSKSSVFAQSLLKANLFPVVLDVLGSQRITNSTDKVIQKLVSNFLATVLNCAKIPQVRSALQETKIVNDFLKFCKAETKVTNAMKVFAYMTIVLLVDEDNAYLLRENQKDGVLRFIMDRLTQTVDSRAPPSGKPGNSCLYLLKCLCCIAQNDVNKVILVYEGILKILTIILKSSEVIEEKRLASKLAWMVSFAKENKSEIERTVALVDILKLSALSDDATVKLNVQGALFELSRTPSNATSVLSKLQARGQARWNCTIYICQNSTTSQPILEYLQNNGITLCTRQANDETVRTDVIEDCSIILVAMDTAFGNSNRCRSETEYAEDLRKTIIPLYMDDSFKTPTWLLHIIRGRDRIQFSPDLTASEFHSRCYELLRGIRQCLGIVVEA